MKGVSVLTGGFPHNVVNTFKDVGKRDFSFLEVSLIVEQLLYGKDYDNIVIVYNHFKNALTYLV
jgi:F0F1-type ATP synthase gamma subunit